MIDHGQQRIADAERTIVGVCLRRPQLIRQVRDSIRSGDFANNACRMIYDAILNVDARNEQPDVVVVDAELAKLHPGRDLTPQMIECATREARAANVTQYCDIVRDASARRAVKEIADRLITGANDADTELAHTIEEARAALAEAVHVRGGWVSTADVLIDTYEDVEARSKGERSPCISGIEPLDALTGGFMPGEMTLIGARPSVGKTALAISIAISTALKGKRVAFVSAEMVKTQVGVRLLSDAANINGMRLRRPEYMDEGDWTALAEGMNAYSRIPIEWLFATQHVEDIIAQTRRQHDRGLADMLIVDYIQLLDTRARFSAADDRLRVGYISKQLVSLAKELNIPVIALAQLRRQYKDHATMPRLDSLKDSGSLEQDADSVILLHEPTWREDDDLREDERAIFDACVDTPRRIKLLNVEKQRNGEKGVVSAIFDGSRNRWAPLRRTACGERAQA